MKRIGIECESIEGKNPDLPAGRQVWGVGRLIIGLLKEISRRPELEKDFRFVLYFKDNIPDFPFLNASIFEKKRVPVPFVKNRLFPIYYLVLLPIKLWFERLDLMFWPAYMLPFFTFTKSLALMTEDVYHEAFHGTLSFQHRFFYAVFGTYSAKFATHLMAISETSKKNLAELYRINSDRIFVNYLGVGMLPFFAQGFEGRQTKGNYLLFVGQAFPRRHLRETILAFEKIAKDLKDLKFIAIGPDKYPPAGRAGEKPVIHSLVKDVNRRLGREAIIHKDYVKDSELTELYAGAKALVYVSDREAFGLPPMEALSFGVPPVVMDNELGHELFGEYAIYSKSGEADDIAYAIKSAITDEQKISKIKSEGPEFVKKYNWKSFADNFFKLIQK